MAIREEKKIDDFPSERTYSDSELRDFHEKIQRFWEEPRTLEDGSIAQRFAHQRLHVAFGAAREVKVGSGTYFLYNERHRAFSALWRQYEDWRRKQNWKEGREIEEFEQMASER